MTPFQETFIPILLLGCIVAGTLACFAGLKSGCLLPGSALLVGTLVFWAAIFCGSDMGYRAWQNMDDPPEEAFSDASVLGALLMGWVPGSFYCILVFGAVRGFRLLLHRTKPSLPSTPASPSTESGNPYQSPSN